MEWIEQNRRWLWVAEGIGVLAAISMLVALKKQGAVEVSRLQVGLMVLPWLLMFLAGMPLLYRSWFRGTPSSISMHALKATYWILATLGFLIFSGIYGIFVLPLR